MTATPTARCGFTCATTARRNRSDAWALAGDLVYVFENIEGPGGRRCRQMYMPVGLAVGSQENLVLATEAMMKSVGYEARRVIPVHEERLKDRFPSRIT